MTSSYEQGYSNSNPNVNKGLQESSPSGIIELFQVDLIPNIHYVPPATIDTTYFFHDGTSNNNFGSIQWTNGNTTNPTVVDYVAIPVKAEGFKFGRGQLPRPTLTFSNALTTFTNILGAVNLAASGSTSTPASDMSNASHLSILINNDLTGAKVTRKRTLEKFLPTSNYTTVPSYNAFDASYPEFPQEIYFIDRKSEENRDIVQFELAANFDLVGVKAPRRLVTKDQFPSAGTFKG
jgi:phage-related protein|tara:strand:+ start:2659 stop:3366 length:708 start_codon:yes stop_codon:yes gene_type:complete